MTKMLERVENAIARADLNASAAMMREVSMEKVAEYAKSIAEAGHYRAFARAAIEAMREPTGEMLDAIYDSEQYYVGMPAWRAAIDAALEEKP